MTGIYILFKVQNQLSALKGIYLQLYSGKKDKKEICQNILTAVVLEP